MTNPPVGYPLVLGKGTLYFAPWPGHDYQPIGQFDRMTWTGVDRGAPEGDYSVRTRWEGKKITDMWMDGRRVFFVLHRGRKARRVRIVGRDARGRTTTEYLVMLTQPHQFYRKRRTRSLRGK